MSDNSFFGGLFDLGSGAINTALGYRASKKLMRKTAAENWKYYQKQLKLQEQIQRRFSRDQTKWSLLYTPAFHMAGLKAAGLNPILAYDSNNHSMVTGSFSGSNMTSQGPVVDPGIDLTSAYEKYTRGGKNETERQIAKDVGEQNVKNIAANTEKTKIDTELNATKQATEERQQDLITAQIEKTQEEAARQRLDNKLKSATNSRDINRAKTEYEVESHTRPNAGIDSNGNPVFPLHDSPYGKYLVNKLLTGEYLSSPLRNKLIDFGRGAAGTAKAVSVFLKKR